MRTASTWMLSVCLCCVMGCPGEVVAPSETQVAEQAATELQQTIHLRTTKPPRLDRSQERWNLNQRLVRFNSDSKVSYIYLVSYGKVMAFYTVKGKVSSVNSMLTTPDQIVARKASSGSEVRTHVVASPDLDGSYGSNGDAVFFFTTDGTYVEWSGEYMLCDKPLKLSTPPELVIEIKDE